jgi:hypothetical protein
VAGSASWGPRAYAIDVVDDDYYELLGVDPHADTAAIRRAYHELAKRWHPDRAGADTAFVFRKLSAAYETLADPASRAVYDRRRGTPPPPPPPEPPPRRRAPGVLLRRLSSPMNILLASGIARRIDDTLYELVLEPDEVAEGGMVTISMRVPVNGVEDLFSAWLAIPPDFEDGTIVHPSVLLPGMQPVAFRLRRS